jgi:PAS domain S-box-containing protein
MTPARILIVEDDRVVARDIQQQLSRIGHTVVGMTARGEDALALARSAQPELVLMDIRLEGGVDGIEAARQVREECRIPVVFLTAYADDETVRRASLTEPFGYLLKPFEDSQLRTVIEMALYKHTAERKLRESERRYATTLSSIGDAVIATDGQALVTFMNPVAETLTGWSLADGVGQPLATVFRIVNEETREPVEDPAAKVLRLGTMVGLANHTVLLTRDGRELPIDDCGAPIVNDQGGITGTVLVFRDVTERRQAEERLRKVQADLAHVSRLTTMGELVASISHEVNQPISAIVTNAEACLRWLAREPAEIEQAREIVDRIIKDGHRAGEIVKSIRVLGRKSSPEMMRFDLTQVIADILNLTRAELRRNNVVLETELPVASEPIAGNPVQLQQVILNLIMNGIEAMTAVTQRPRILRVTAMRGEGDVRISVADSGLGLDPANSDRIFDPFFTTRREGMGLGLSICRSIIEAHGGRLWASPNRPHGSIFQFTVPREGGDRPLER